MAIVETDKPAPRPRGHLRPEMTALSDGQKSAVHQRLKHRKVRCGNCGERDFTVGDALYLGFLFLSEPQDAYMVALTCRNQDCTAPRTGITLSRADFLSR